MRLDDTPAESKHLFPSTKWAYKKVILTGRPRPEGQRASGAPSTPLRARDPRSPITVELAYKGGAEAKWLVKARGRTWHFPGSMAIHDVMGTINATIPHWQQ
jgi:hypothetical protein